MLPGGLVRRGAQLVLRGPSLSVLVPVTDDNVPFLDESMRALDAQLSRGSEVLLVELGTARSTRDAVDREAAGRWRVRRLQLPGESVAAGLNQGARRASGSHLVFWDAGDVLAETALNALADVLTQREVEVVGATRSDLGRVRLEDLVVRRSLWRRSGISVPEGPYGRWWSAARLVLEARGAVRAPRHLRVDDRRGTGVAFGTMPVLAPWVGSWWSAVAEVLEALGDDPVKTPFFSWLLDEETVGYLADVERCTPQEWALLVGVAADLLGSAPVDLVAELKVESRVRLWLAAGGHRAALERFNAARWLEEGQFPTHVEDGLVYADLPIEVDPVPMHVLALGAAETRLVTVLRRMSWGDAGELELDLFAFIRGLTSDAARSSHAVWLVDADGVRTALPVVRRTEPEVNVVAGERFVDHAAGAFHAVVDADTMLRRASPGDHWHLEVELEVEGVVRRGRVSEVEARGSVGALPPHRPSGLLLRAVATSTDGWDLVATSSNPDGALAEDEWRVTDVRLDGGDLVLRGAVGSVAPGVVTLALRGPQSTAPVAVEISAERFHARVALCYDPYGLGTRPLLSGNYRLYLHAAGHEPRRVSVAAELAAETPFWQRSDTFRMRVQRSPDGGLLTTLAAPLEDDEIGPYAQQRLQRWYASDEHRLDPSAVYLQSYTGQVATDSPLAIHHALRRLRPDLKLYWSVADRSAAVPEGGQPVVLRSRDWYRALATCGSVITNIDLDWWFNKRPGQRVLQSFHGYPSKTMGIAAWEAKNFTPLRIDRLLRRTSGTWDLLLTPTPAMDVHYRREYRYDGEILAQGYPRDDVFVGPDAERIREATRMRLGVAQAQRVVLYAPTWRDDLATNFRAAGMTTSFDVEQAAAELGEDYVVLMRGHRFHRRRPDAAGARLLDVTDYPEINDLILAADAAVLDYSSLRFDFALTGRPMVFVVPDLDRYTASVRGFLFDFSSSAPGPHVAGTRDVVAELRDLDRLTSKYRGELDRFNSEFNSHQDGGAAERAVRAFFGPGPAVR